jgi:hypothetical protein
MSPVWDPPGCTETVSKTPSIRGYGAVLERKGDFPSYCFNWKSSKRGERLERAGGRPRPDNWPAVSISVNSESARKVHDDNYFGPEDLDSCGKTE